MICKNCSSNYEGNFCPDCGTPAIIICKKCANSYEGKFCPKCGEPAHVEQRFSYTQSQSQPTPPTIVITNTNTNTNTSTATLPTVSIKSKWVAFFLCLFFGMFGIHRFYVGKVGSGILYIFTCGLFFIGWFVDLVTILLGGFRDSNRMFLR